MVDVVVRPADHCRDPEPTRCSVCGRDGNEAVRTVIARGYACVLVVLAVGFVALVLGTSFMAFMHPERGQQFLQMYAVPGLTILGIYVAKGLHGYIKLVTGER